MRQEVLLAKLLREFRPLWEARGSRHFNFRWQLPGRQFFVEGNMSRINTEEQVKVTVVPKTARGNPATIDGAVEFTSSDPNVATVTPIDNLSAMVKSVAPGVAQIFASFDADLGEGVRAVEMSGALEVVPAEATVGEIVFGSPEPKV